MPSIGNVTAGRESRARRAVASVPRSPDWRLRLLIGSTRAAIIGALRTPSTTPEVAAATGIAPSTASEHLTALAEIGVVDRRRRGRRVHYVLNDRGEAILDALRD